MHTNSLKSPSLSGMSTFLFYSKTMKVVIVDSLAKNNDNINPDKELDELLKLVESILCKRVGRRKRQFDNSMLLVKPFQARSQV